MHRFPALLLLLLLPLRAHAQHAEGWVPRFDLESSGLVLERPTHAGAFFDVLGRKAGAFGYAGWVGCEDNPRGDTVEGLIHAPEWPEIEEAGRTLRLAGDLKVAVFPSLGAKVEALRNRIGCVHRSSPRRAFKHPLSFVETERPVQMGSGGCRSGRALLSGGVAVSSQSRRRPFTRLAMGSSRTLRPRQIERPSGVRPRHEHAWFEAFRTPSRSAFRSRFSSGRAGPLVPAPFDEAALLQVDQVRQRVREAAVEAHLAGEGGLKAGEHQLEQGQQERRGTQEVSRSIEEVG